MCALTIFRISVKTWEFELHFGPADLPLPGRISVKTWEFELHLTHTADLPLLGRNSAGELGRRA